MVPHWGRHRSPGPLSCAGISMSHGPQNGPMWSTQPPSAWAKGAQGMEKQKREQQGMWHVPVIVCPW